MESSDRRGQQWIIVFSSSWLRASPRPQPTWLARKRPDPAVGPDGAARQFVRHFHLKAPDRRRGARAHIVGGIRCLHLVRVQLVPELATLIEKRSGWQNWRLLVLYVLLLVFTFAVVIGAMSGGLRDADRGCPAGRDRHHGTRRSLRCAQPRRTHEITAWDGCDHWNHSVHHPAPSGGRHMVAELAHLMGSP